MAKIGAPGGATQTVDESDGAGAKLRTLAYVICPKCQNQMLTVDRGGVHIEQCQGCRGIFLDRGELEQIATAERTYYQGAPVPPPPPAHMPPPGYRHDSPPPYAHHGGHGYRDSPPPYGGHRGHGYRDSPPPYGHSHGHKRKKSFLEGLFD